MHWNESGGNAPSDILWFICIAALLLLIVVAAGGGA